MSTRQVIKQIKLHYSKNKTNKIQIYSEDFVFDKNCYDPKRLSQWLSKKEFNIIISELNKIVTKSFIKKNKAERIKVYNFIYFLLGVITLFFILGSFCLFQAQESYDPKSESINLAYVIGIVLFSLMLILLLGLSCYNFKHITYQMITLENTIHNYIKQYIGFLNLYFQGVLKWVYHQTIVMIEITVLNNEDEDHFVSSGFNHSLLQKRTEYFDDLFDVFEEENDDIGKEIESSLYKRKTKEEVLYCDYNQSKIEKMETDSLIQKESFELTKMNLRKVIEKNKKRRLTLLNFHTEYLKAAMRRSYSH